MDRAAVLQRVNRLRALRDRPGTIAEGLAAARALRLLVLKYGSLLGDLAGERKTSLLLGRPEWIGQTARFTSNPIPHDAIIGAIEAGPGTQRHEWMITEAGILSRDGGNSHIICKDRRAWLLAYGRDPIRKGEQVQIAVMRNSVLSYYPSGLVSVRVLFRDAVVACGHVDCQANPEMAVDCAKSAHKRPRLGP